MLSIRIAIICGLLAGSLIMSPQTAPGAETFPPVSELPELANLPDPLVSLKGEQIQTPINGVLCDGPS